MALGFEPQPVVHFEVPALSAEEEKQWEALSAERGYPNSAKFMYAVAKEFDQVEYFDEVCGRLPTIPLGVLREELSAMEDAHASEGTDDLRERFAAINSKVGSSVIPDDAFALFGYLDGERLHVTLGNESTIGSFGDFVEGEAIKRCRKENKARRVMGAGSENFDTTCWVKAEKIRRMAWTAIETAVLRKRNRPEEQNQGIVAVCVLRRAGKLETFVWKKGDSATVDSLLAELAASRQRLRACVR